MRAVTWPRVLAGAGLLLALVMVVLLSAGPSSKATYYTWVALVIVGLGLFGFGQRIDAGARRTRLDDEREERIRARREAQGG